MSDTYIGNPYSGLVSPNFVKEDFIGNGSLTEFTLTNEVPGGNEENLMVVVENVVQEPTASFTIEQINNQYKKLKFTEAPVNGAIIYVTHRGIGTINTAPAAGSVTAATLASNLTTFTTDSFTAGASQADFIMSQATPSLTSILVTVDGIVQKATTNYTVVQTTVANDTVRFTSNVDENSEVEVKHLGILTTSRRIPDSAIVNSMIADGTITSAKLATGEDWGLVTGSLDSNLDFGSV